MTLVAPERQYAPTSAAVALPNRTGPLSLGQMTPFEAWKFAETLADSPLLPPSYRKQPASVLWAMEYGRALGLDVVTTITTIHVIKGKPTQSADLMLSRAREAGHRVRIKPERTQCTVAIQRHDDPDDETVIEWTLDDAVTAGLCQMRNDRPYARDEKGQPLPWEKYPRAMLRSRAIAEAVRTACPEVLHGAIYTPEELGEVVDQNGDAVVVDRAYAPPVEQSAVVVQSSPNPPPSRRDYRAEAEAAESPARFAEVRAAAEGSGAPPEVLAALDVIAERKRADAIAREYALGAAREAGPASEYSSLDPSDDMAATEGLPDRQAAAEHATARAEMYAAAHAAGMNSRAEADAAFFGVAGVTPADATVEQLREQAATLRQIAGAA